MSFLDWSIVGVYCLFVIIVGIYYSKRAESGMTEFFLSGRKLPWWIAGTSMVATSFAADTPLYVTDLVRTQGIRGNWQWWAFCFAGMCSVFFFSKLWRRIKVITDVEFVELRYDGESAKALRLIKAVYLGLIYNCVIIAMPMVAISEVVDQLFGMNKFYTLLIFSSIAFLYSALSGLWAVVVTDLVQFVIAMAGAIALAIYGVIKVGGYSAFIEKISTLNVEKGTLNFTPQFSEIFTNFSFQSLAEAGFVAFGFYAFIMWWNHVNVDGGGVIIQRMSSCKNEKHAFLATLWFNFAHYALRTWPWIVAALASIILIPSVPPGKSDQFAYPMMISMLPSGLIGLLAVSFFAAFMSTIDTQVNWGSSYLVNDVYKRFLVKDANQKHYVWASRITGLVILVVALFIALGNDRVLAIFKYAIKLKLGLGLVYILRWYWWRVNAWSEISAMVASFITTNYLALTSNPNIGFYESSVIIISVTTVVWMIVTLITSPVSVEHLRNFRKRARVGGFGWRKINIDETINTDSIWLSFMGFIGGFMFVIGSMFAMGKLILGYPTHSIIWLIVTILGIFMMLPAWKFSKIAQTDQN